VVIVFPVVVAFIVIVPEVDHTVPATKNKDPLTANVGLVPRAKVAVPADTVRSRHVNAPVQLTVYVPA
jgi:hypothetical protein